MTPEVALRKVKDKVDIAMSDPSFPDDLPSDPNIFDLNFTELVPVMQVNLSGDYPIDQLEDYAEILQERIEDVEQINEAEIRGVNAKEMEVEVDHLRAEAMLVSFNDIAQAIGQENLSISGGDILMDGRRRTVQVVGDFRDAQDLESIIVKAEGGKPVYLRDLATVRFVDQEATSFAREWGNPVVSLDIRKRAGENLIIASDEINRIIKEAKAEFLPSDLNVSITSDQSDRSARRNTTPPLSGLLVSMVDGWTSTPVGKPFWPTKPTLFNNMGKRKPCTANRLFSRLPLNPTP